MKIFNNIVITMTKIDHFIKYLSEKGYFDENQIQ